MIPDDLPEHERAEFWRYIRESNTAVSFEPGRCPLMLVQIMALKKRVESGRHFQDDLQTGG